MKRGISGRYQVSRVGGEEVRAFVPFPLPPDPPVVLDGRRQTLLEQALLALGRLDSLSMLLPDPTLFLYGYIRKEAVLSSQIEGTQSSLSDLLLYELDEAPGVPLHDVVEVSNYVSAMEHGLARLRENFPLSNRLIREIHNELLARGRGSDKSPGEFRQSQNWIGGTRPGNAHFVPPPASEVPTCIGALESFLNDNSTPLPILVRIALAHVQFETIHPFLDGNGRVGRLLITLVACERRLLSEPLLYLSLYFKEHRDEYYRLLDDVRSTGNWEAWLDFFLEGVRYTAAEAVDLAQRLAETFDADAERVRQSGRVAGSALRVHAALKGRPIATLAEVTRRTGLSFPAASAGMQALVNLGVARELTGRRRNRVFAYDRYLALLAAGTEARPV